jgi:hypothetical protein
MIPSVNTLLNQKIEFVEQTSYTFYLDTTKNRVYGYTDTHDAMKQAIYLILETERYRHVILSWNYGFELEDLFGRQMSFVLSELKRRIQEALLQDSRILAVDDFEFSVEGNTISAAFTAHTIFGEVPVEKVVIV